MLNDRTLRVETQFFGHWAFGNLPESRRLSMFTQISSGIGTQNPKTGYDKKKFGVIISQDMKRKV